MSWFSIKRTSSNKAWSRDTWFTRTTLQSIAVLVFCLAVFAAQAGEIYKWVDKDGSVHYSQDPQNQSAQPMKIKIPKTTSSSDENSNQAEPAAPQDTPEQPNAGEDNALKETTAKKQQEAHEKNCQIAMKRLATITAGGRLYEMDEKGERHYWDDETRNGKMADAQKDVDKWCGQE